MRAITCYYIQVYNMHLNFSHISILTKQNLLLTMLSLQYRKFFSDKQKYPFFARGMVAFFASITIGLHGT
jgi:hypothetical protein